MALHLDEEFYPRFLTTIAGRRAIDRAIDKGMRDGLVASINHGKAGRGLADVATYNPSAEANYDSAVNALRIADFPLLAQSTIREVATSQWLSISDAMVPLIELLSAENLVCEANTSGVPTAVVATTALSTTFVQASFVPPIPVSDNKVVDMEPHAKASSSFKIIIDQETLETLPKHLAT
nr:hypothetical protein [Tanacetum cinerariifolium]